MGKVLLIYLSLLICSCIPTVAKKEPVVGNQWGMNCQLSSLYRQERYAEALILAGETLTITEETLGPNHRNLATALINIGRIYQAQGRHAEAEPLFTRSLAIYEEALERDHPAVATLLGYIAKSAGEMGKNDEARKLTTRVKEIASRVEANAYHWSEADQPPAQIRNPNPPKPPPSSDKKHIQEEPKPETGKVTLWFIVTREGMPVFPRIVKEEPPGFFGDTALKAILRWRFKPAIKNGKPVDVIVVAPMRFERLRGDDRVRE